MPDAPRYGEGMQYVMSPLQGFAQSGAAGTAQQSQTIIPPGYGSQQGGDFMTNAIEGLSNVFMQQAAQKRLQQAMAPILPEFEKMGYSTDELNAYLAGGGSPKDLVNKLFEEKSYKSHLDMNLTQARKMHDQEVQQNMLTPGDLDTVDKFRRGDITSEEFHQAIPYEKLDKAMQLSERELALTKAQALAPYDVAEKRASTVIRMAEASAKPAEINLDLQTKAITLHKDIEEVKHAQTREDIEKARLKLEQDKFAFDKDYKVNIAPGLKGGGKLSPEIQTTLNNVKQQPTANDMYMTARKGGIKVRMPDAFEMIPGGEAKYLKVIQAAAANKAIAERKTAAPTQQGGYQFPKGPYGMAAPKAAQSAGVDPDVFGRLIQQESGWNPGAKSPVGAFGLGQFMPGLAKKYGYSDAQLKADPKLQLDLSAKYLKEKLDEFGGDYAKAVAAYNAGSAAVHKYNGVPPYKETQAYVNAILGTQAVKPASTKRRSLDEILPGANQ